MRPFSSALPGAENRKLESTFHASSVSLFILMAVLLMLAMTLMLHSITKTVSRDYAELYSSRTIGIINTHLNREIGLMKKAVQSRSIVEWFEDEGNYGKKIDAYTEMKSFMGVLNSANLYFGVASSLNEYSMDAGSSFTDYRSFATLSRDLLKDRWYFECADSANDYVLNVDIDKLKQRKLVWLNYKVESEGKFLGVLATGLQFDHILEEIFGEYDQRNVRSVVIDEHGVIQMDSDIADVGQMLIYESRRNLMDEARDPAFKEALGGYLASISGFFGPGSKPTVVPVFTGRYSYASIAPIEATNWTVVTFYNSSSLFSTGKLWPVFMFMLAMFVAYSLAVSITTRKLIFAPFSRLMASLEGLGAESSDQPIYGTERNDEIGKLARTVRDMKSRLDSHAAQLVEEMERAENASRAKSEFLANMSHEMRTPMNAIIGMSKIAKDAEGMPKIRYCLDKIEGASAHLLGVINDILDMSKIESGKFDIHTMPFQFGKMLARVCGVLNFRMAQKNLKFTVTVDPDVPAHVVGDEQRLAQVITNLLANAEKFTPENGSVALAVHLEEERDGVCTVRVSVRDTGIGISREGQERLFRSFEQADSGISRKYGGTGLGLAITKRIVEMMGGSIGLESEEGIGSCFFFTIPLARASEAETGPDKAAAGTRPAAGLRGRRILLAEDVELNREIVITLLEGTGIVFECAENGREAVEMFARAPGAYDMILMDVQMPELDGYEATRRIRAMPVPEAGTVPIIAMTANAFREDVEKSREAGMNGHLGKPLDMDELHAVFNRYFSGWDGPRNP